MTNLYMTEQRPEETGQANMTSLTYALTEGKTVFNQTYVAPMATEIILDR
jgi:hypothetical protein